ncbi:hypothetical protein ERJ75_001548300 [Trypanosoma vivax]|nr:hypothetical protein ERJ75_001548300 [Trypanosoma vivax]
MGNARSRTILANRELRGMVSSTKVPEKTHEETQSKGKKHAKGGRGTGAVWDNAQAQWPICDRSDTTRAKADSEKKCFALASRNSLDRGELEELRDACVELQRVAWRTVRLRFFRLRAGPDEAASSFPA